MTTYRQYNNEVMKNIFIYLTALTLTLTGCSFLNPVSKAQDLASKGKFEEGIKILETEYKKDPNSVPIKSILAQTYSDYGLALCQDTEKPPNVKYPKAKEQFAMALELNPYLTDAKDMFEMIEKIQAQLSESMIN